MTKKNIRYVLENKKNLIANTTTFPVLNQVGTGMQRISISKGDLLTPHWHPNSNETTYCLSGEGEVGLVVPHPTEEKPLKAVFRRHTFRQGDIVFLPQGFAHYFANTGTEDLVLLLTFDNPDFDILTLAYTLDQLPENIAAAAKAAASNPKSLNSPLIPYDK